MKGHTAFTTRFQGLVRDLKTTIGVRFGYNTSSLFPTKKFVAIRDTGATCTVITSKVVRELGLEPLSMTQVHGVNSKQDCYVYVVDILLPNNVVIQDVNVIESEFGGGDILIGMDII